MRVNIDGLSMSFGSVEALRDIDLDIANEEFMTLLGPSGSGKSTLLRLLAGLEKPASGSIRFDGLAVGDLPANKRDIAMVFQSYALYPHLSVEDNLAFPLRMMRTHSTEVTRRVRETAELLGIEGLLERKPRELSGGQRQRVALGRAIIRRPGLFLLDEPLSNLDAQLRIAMRTEIKRLHSVLRTTFVYVTHDQAEALTMSDRITVLDRGVMQQVGTPADIYARPVNLFVAQFIGSPPMSIVDVRVESQAGHVRFIAGSIAIDRPASLAGVSGGRLAIGVRSEDVLVSRVASAGAAAGIVYSSEPAGPDLYLTLDMDGPLIRARTDPEGSWREGEKVWVQFRKNRLQFFDTTSKQAVPFPDAISATATSGSSGTERMSAADRV